jgi:hypothetical protein
MRRKGASSLRLRTAAVASVAVIALVAFGSATAAAATERTITTFKNWDGRQFVGPFGCSGNTTWGQTIRIPAGFTHLNRFTFAWNSFLHDGSMVVRAEVYAWDGEKATGSSLFEHKRTISFNEGGFHRETFKPNGISVTPGKQYVLFASIDKDYEKCQNNYDLYWGIAVGTRYRGGIVYQGNGGDESRWTTTPWFTYGGRDVAFKFVVS